MSIKETSIDKISGEEYLTVYSNEKAIVNKIKKLKSQYPTEVIIIKEYEDGTINAHFPSNWFRFVKPPTKRNYTEEQKNSMSERMKSIRKSRKEYK